jgi:hypothetical protein
MQDWELTSALFEVADILCYSFDIDLHEARPAPDWFSVPGARATAFATDATGGVFALCETEGQGPSYAIYVEPRARAVVLGNSLADAIRLIIALPYWRELAGPGSGRALDTLRQQANVFERELLEDMPAANDAREELYRVLGVAPLPDPLMRLWQLNGMAPPQLTIAAADGWVYLDGSSPLRGPTPGPNA